MASKMITKEDAPRVVFACAMALFYLICIILLVSPAVTLNIVMYSSVGLSFFDLIGTIGDLQYFSQSPGSEFGGLTGLLSVVLIIVSVIGIIIFVCLVFFKSPSMKKLTSSYLICSGIFLLLLGICAFISAGLISNEINKYYMENDVAIATTFMSGGGLTYIIFGALLITVWAVVRKKMKFFNEENI